MTNEKTINLLKNTKELLFLFKENGREQWGNIRELLFAIVLKDHSEYSKFMMILNNRAYGCKEQEKIKNKIAKISGYFYSKDLLISNKKLDEYFINN